MVDRSEFIETAYLKYRHSVFLYFTKYFGGDADKCHDGVQIVFLRALKTFNSKRMHGDNPYKWLMSIARSVAVDMMRKKREVPIDTDANPPPPVPPPSRDTRIEALEHCLELLPEGERTLALEKHANEFTWEELSRMTGISLGTLRYKLQKILERLSKCIEGFLGESR